MTLTLTTPTQETFTVGAPAGSMVDLVNNSTGEQFSYLVGYASQPGSESTYSVVGPSRRFQEFTLLVFKIDSGSPKQIAANLHLREGEDFLEPASGLLFRIVPGAEQKIRSFLEAGEGSLNMCCVDCGAYSVCGARVSACGSTCYNTTPPLNFVPSGQCSHAPETNDAPNNSEN